MFAIIFTFCAISIVAVSVLGIATNLKSDMSVFGGF